MYSGNDMVDANTFGIPNPTAYDVYIINPDGTGLRKIQSEVGGSEFYCSWDGSYYTYQDENGHVHLCDIAKGTNRIIKLYHPKEDGCFVMLRFIYLSRQKAVYILNTDPDVQYRVANLNTLATKPISLPYASNDMEISPSLTKYWFIQGNTYPKFVKLHVVDIPKETIDKLKQP